MKMNEAGWDRTARVIAGIVMLLVPILFTREAFGIVIGILGLILLVTGLIGFCPLYSLLKVSTKKP